MRKQERSSLLVLEKLKKVKPLGRLKDNEKKGFVNPIVRMLFVSMSFKAWMNYTEKIEKRGARNS
jgi:hypothetical protein